MTDIVERLQAVRTLVYEDGTWKPLTSADADCLEGAAKIKQLRIEVEQLKAAIAYVRQRSQRACEILNEFNATEQAHDPRA